MTSEHSPLSGENDTALEGQEILRVAVAGSYMQDFGKDPGRAQAAQDRAQEVIARVLTHLDEVGFPLEAARSAGLDEEELHRILSWAAFDYSFPRAEGDGFEVVNTNTLVTLMLQLLVSSNLDFPGVVAKIEATITAMRTHRQEALLGLVRAPGVDSVFKTDFKVVNGSLFPPED